MAHSLSRDDGDGLVLPGLFQFEPNTHDKAPDHHPHHPGHHSMDPHHHHHHHQQYHPHHTGVVLDHAGMTHHPHQWDNEEHHALNPPQPMTMNPTHDTTITKRKKATPRADAKAKKAKTQNTADQQSPRPSASILFEQPLTISKLEHTEAMKAVKALAESGTEQQKQEARYALIELCGKYYDAGINDSKVSSIEDTEVTTAFKSLREAKEKHCKETLEDLAPLKIQLSR
eukprot:m.143183 g.143183  ORF g.143183 m.143183 type:complete len:229 (-) comp14893_c0_seq22:1851-2537(-)